MAEDDRLFRKVLGTENFPSNYNPNNVPKTGEEYLHYVYYEAKNCEEYIQKQIDEEKLQKKGAQQPNTIYCQELSGCKTAPKEIIPSTEWQLKQVSDFSAFRLHIQRLKQQYQVNESLALDGELPQWQERFKIEPKLSDVILLRQMYLNKILGYICEILKKISNAESIPYSLGVWLYSTLACLEIPFSPEQSSQLREIARNCAEIRAKLVEPYDEELYKPLNLFICLIARYFNNNDLMDVSDLP